MPKSPYLSDFELFIMLAIAALDDNAYGVTIAERISDRTGRDVSIGAVYATLGRLSEKGYLAFTFSEPEPTPGGRAKKLAMLTATGKRALRQTTDAIAGMLEGVTLNPAVGRGSGGRR